jgi:hypothetical protein
MKKIQLVEMGIIAAVLVMGYKMITSLLALITTLLFGLGSGINQNIMMAILPTFLFFAFYTITFFLLARNVKRLARFIYGQDEESLDLKLNKISVLHVIIIAICLSSFLQTVPNVIEYVAGQFISRPMEQFDYYDDRSLRVSFWNSLIGLVLSIILLVTAKNIAVFFGKDEHSFEIGGEKIEDNN